MKTEYREYAVSRSRDGRLIVSYKPGAMGNLTPTLVPGLTGLTSVPVTAIERHLTAEQDNRFGRWRDPDDRDYVVYDASLRSGWPEGTSFAVLYEPGGGQVLYNGRGEAIGGSVADTRAADEVAARYLATHPHKRETPTWAEDGVQIISWVYSDGEGEGLPHLASRDANKTEKPWYYWDSHAWSSQEELIKRIGDADVMILKKDGETLDDYL